MNHHDHVALIRDGVEGARLDWLELGAGEGAFTLALADCLAADVLAATGRITTMDRDERALRTGLEAVRARFPSVTLTAVTGDFTRGLPPGPFDGVLAANSLHFVRDRRPVLAAIRANLRPGGRLIVVEYNADSGNPWVPHPFSFGRWRAEAEAAGFEDVHQLHRVPSRFLGAIYGAVATLPGQPNTVNPANPVLHSRPHGDDREE